jgi:hemolysin activation/secretion protein
MVTVTTFRFTGNTLLGNDELAPLVAEYLNRPISFAELQKAAAAVAEAYRAAGWVVRAYLPQQDIQNGVVTIQIVEAVFGGVKIEGVPAKRIALAQIQNGFEAQQPKGAPLNSNALDRALLLADDLPGVAVSGSLQEGANARETDLILKLADEPIIVGEASLDNTGSRSTGSERFTANLNFNSPFGYGDLVSSNLIHTQGSDYLRLGFTLPVGADGWRVGANASALSYRLIAPEFAALNGKGTSSTVGLDANYPIIRSRLKNLYLGMNYDQKQFDNQSSGAIQSHYQIDTFTANLNGNLFDNLGGGGANSASLALVSGRVALGNLDAGENAALGGSFSKLRYSLSRQQVITDSVAFYAALSGQDANSKNLDSSEKFYLGGSGGVRAYPTSEGGGSSGNLLNLELRGRLPQGFVLTGFYDHGHVSNYDGSQSYSLKGAGASLSWQAEFGLNLKATWAQRIGTNPNPTATGNDQDGSLHKNRFWLTASQPF